MSHNPWEQTVLVGVGWCKVHWFMRLFFRRIVGFDHVWLLRPLGDSRWIYTDWSLQGLCVRVLSHSAATRLIHQSNGVLRYHCRDLPRPFLPYCFLPTSCAGVVRQIVGLPGTWRFWHSPQSLWCELRKRGAEVVLKPILDPMGDP